MRLILSMACVLGALLVAGCGSKPIAPEITEYQEPSPWMELEDDALPSPLPFQEGLVHPDAVDGWQVNLSAAVLRLDVPALRLDQDAELHKLHPHYRAAIAAAGERQWLPSVNLIDGKAKQFDDGLFMAIDLAMFQLGLPGGRGDVDRLRELGKRAGPTHAAAPWISAALELAGVEWPAQDMTTQRRLLAEFERRALDARPLGCYEWSDELRRCYRCLRFLQHPAPVTAGLPEDVQALSAYRALAALLGEHSDLRRDYESMLAFRAGLTNPFHVLSLLDLLETPDDEALLERANAAGLVSEVAILPSSTSREVRLFERLFPKGLPPGADLMGALIQAVQLGEVDLTPEATSGWYDWQCHALETLVLPSRGVESRKLLLTARYKQRTLGAFAALLAKRRETHVRQLDIYAKSVAPEIVLSPRLRLEPNATYYLRTARAYAFVQQLLERTWGRDKLGELHGLAANAQRSATLLDELESQRRLFAGCYLLACEDLGLDVESDAVDAIPGNAAEAKEQALAWLGRLADEPDLAVDTRVIVPVAVDPSRQVTSVWGTAGVRLARLVVSFEPQRLPSLRRVEDQDDWREWRFTESTEYLIPVDEFIGAELRGLRCPTRSEYRSVCDAAPDRDTLIAKLQE